MDSDRTAQALDIARRAAGFLTVHEVTALAPDVRVLDPGSVLIGRAFPSGPAPCCTRPRPCRPVTEA